MSEHIFNMKAVQVDRSGINSDLLEGPIDYVELLDRDQILKGNDTITFKDIPINVRDEIRAVYEHFGILKSEVGKILKIVYMRAGMDPDKIHITDVYPTLKGQENSANAKLRECFQDIRREYPQPEEIIKFLEDRRNG